MRLPTLFNVSDIKKYLLLNSFLHKNKYNFFFKGVFPETLSECRLL